MTHALALLGVLAATPLEAEADALLQKYFSVHHDGVLHLVPWSDTLLAPIAAGEVAWFARVVDETANSMIESATGADELGAVITYLRTQPRLVALFGCVRDRLRASRFALRIELQPTTTTRGLALRFPPLPATADALAAGVVFPGDHQFSVGGSPAVKCSHQTGCRFELGEVPANVLTRLRRKRVHLEFRWVGMGESAMGHREEGAVPVHRVDDVVVLAVDDDQVVWSMDEGNAR